MDLATYKENERALLAATRKGDIVQCRRLVIDVQTDVNAREDENEVGWSPLLIASRGGFTDLVELFISHGADVNARSRSHQTPLHAAAWNGHEIVVTLLLSHGAAVNVQNKFGQVRYHQIEFRYRFLLLLLQLISLLPSFPMLL